jgi:hypothetical protein
LPIGRAPRKSLVAGNDEKPKQSKQTAAVIQVAPPSIQTRRSARQSAQLNKTVVEKVVSEKEEEEEEDEEEKSETEEEDENGEVEEEQNEEAVDSEDDEEVDGEEEEGNEGEDVNDDGDDEDDELDEEDVMKKIEDRLKEETNSKIEIDVVSNDVNNNKPELKNEGETTTTASVEVVKHEAVEVEVKLEREEIEEYKNELKNWSCLCLTLEDWVALNEKYKQSKKKIDQDISKIIETNYLPEMPALFQKAVINSSLFIIYIRLHLLKASFHVPRSLDRYPRGKVKLFLFTP